MSNIYTSADQLIGKTPLLELAHIEKEENLESALKRQRAWRPASWPSWSISTPPGPSRTGSQRP